MSKGDKTKFSTNVEVSAILFESIKNYPFLHSTPYLVKVIIYAVKKDIPTIGAFLEARMLPFESSRKP